MKWSRCRSDISFSLAAATVSENESFGSISTEDGISYDKVGFTVVMTFFFNIKVILLVALTS